MKMYPNVDCYTLKPDITGKRTKKLSINAKK